MWLSKLISDMIDMFCRHTKPLPVRRKPSYISWLKNFLELRIFCSWNPKHSWKKRIWLGLFSACKYIVMEI